MKNSDIQDLEDRLNKSRSNSREKVKITENVPAPRNKTASDNKRATTTPKTAKKALSSDRKSSNGLDKIVQN